MREKWSNRGAFVLASIGSAVGLGNAWRFPGLCAKYGGGAFLFAYIICMLALGIPLLMMETAIGRKAQGGAPKAMRLVNKKAEPVGWAAVANAFVILTYYAVVFAWCILMCFLAFKFATTHSTPETASNLWAESVLNTSGTSFIPSEGRPNAGNISIILLLCLGLAWAFIYGCIRNGVSQVGKVVKFTVFLPVAMLLILAGRGFINNPHLGEALGALFIPKWEAFGNVNLWVAAMGQSFYSLSIMMAIMFAYGSYLKKTSNIAVDSIIIAFSDLAISVLSGIVLFTTMYSTGKTVADMSDSGVKTAYIIYPTAIVNLTPFGVGNAIFGFVFYFMLCTLAIDSAFSILEGVAAAVADKFKLPKKKTTLIIAIIAALISIVYITGVGVSYLDIVDNWTNAYSLIIIGLLEALFVGWFFKPKKVLNEINKNTDKFKMPSWWFITSIKILAPLALGFLFVWQIIALIKNGFRYEKSYDLAAEIIAGWVVTVLVFASGFIIKFVVKKVKNSAEIAEDEANELSWDDLDKQDKYEDEITTLVEESVENIPGRDSVEEPK
ncbi:MAG: sodium-dependent transporter [Acholeplasmatales bacterium]|nr:sodium-dependent transporter [Acholeplasmatales bacterium]